MIDRIKILETNKSWEEYVCSPISMKLQKWRKMARLLKITRTLKPSLIPPICSEHSNFFPQMNENREWFVVVAGR